MNFDGWVSLYYQMYQGKSATHFIYFICLFIFFNIKLNMTKLNYGKKISFVYQDYYWIIKTEVMGKILNFDLNIKQKTFKNKNISLKYHFDN